MSHRYRSARGTSFYCSVCWSPGHLEEGPAVVAVAPCAPCPVVGSLCSYQNASGLGVFIGGLTLCPAV